MFKVLNLILLGTLVLGACAGMTGEGTELPDTVVIEYQRSGGFTGSEEIWSIYGDGRVIHSQGSGTEAQGREWKISQEQIQAFLEQAEELGFFKMKAEYMPLDTCCDRFTHRLIINRASGSNSVMTIDAAKEAPAELWSLIDEIKRLVEE